MTFNWEISVGSIMAVMTVIAGIFGFYYSTRNDMQQLKDAMTAVKDDLKMLNKVVMDVALSNVRQDNFEKRTDDRFKHMEEDIREMKHGDGFVTKRREQA